MTQKTDASPQGRDNRATDVVTGTLLRPFFLERVEQFVQTGALDDLHIITVEISRFGFVNDSVGPSLGDRLLVMTAERLRKLFPDALAIGRMHGDHFALAFDSQSDIKEDVEKLLEFTQRPFVISKEVIVLSVRIGAADASCDAESSLQMLHAAEVALHQSKSSQAKVTYFDAGMIGKAKEIHQLENDLRVSLVANVTELHRALNNQEFLIEYQPIVDTSSNTVHALEALLRWQHPKKGLIPPGRFIPMAEEIRIMGVLGGWVIRRACIDAAAWPPNADGTYPCVAINVSKTQFLEPELLLQNLEQAISETGITPERIEIELTESMSTVPGTTETVKQIRKLGCKVALDDFGTGYSSLTQLQNLQLDYVKVDQCFVKDIGSDDTEAANSSEQLARAIIMLGGAMNITPIVEGVETAHQLDIVQNIGARYIQGFVLSRPIAQEAVSDLITRNARNKDH